MKRIGSTATMDEIISVLYAIAALIAGTYQNILIIIIAYSLAGMAMFSWICAMKCHGEEYRELEKEKKRKREKKNDCDKS